jgi:S-adenosylmethionine hydrolase
LKSRYITFLSDFGLEDDFVGVCKGVISGIAPDATVIDITHGIPPQDVTQGAVVLARAIPYTPVCVHLAVVDPGVGGTRNPVAVRTSLGRIFIGPDNGLLLLAADREGIEEARTLTNPRYHLGRVSRTFHARDVFAPTAAHLAAGAHFADLGDEVDPTALVRLDLPEPELRDGKLLATVLTVDHFGNVALNLTRDHLDAIEASGWVELQFDATVHRAQIVETFADTKPGQLVLYESSYGAVALAVREGSAATLTGARAGDLVQVRAVDNQD